MVPKESPIGSGEAAGHSEEVSFPEAQQSRHLNDFFGVSGTDYRERRFKERLVSNTDKFPQSGHSCRRGGEIKYLLGGIDVWGRGGMNSGWML